METLKLGGAHNSDLVSTPLLNRKQPTYSGSMLTPSEIEFLRRDKGESLDRFAEMQRQERASKAAIDDISASA